MLKIEHDKKNCRVRLKAREEGMTREKVSETVFTTTEILFIRSFVNFSAYTVLSSEKMEMKARKTIFMKILDRHVGHHSKEEIKAEIYEEMRFLMVETKRLKILAVDRIDYVNNLRRLLRLRERIREKWIEKKNQITECTMNKLIWKRIHKSFRNILEGLWEGKRKYGLREL